MSWQQPEKWFPPIKSRKFQRFPPIKSRKFQRVSITKVKKFQRVPSRFKSQKIQEVSTTRAKKFKKVSITKVKKFKRVPSQELQKNLSDIWVTAMLQMYQRLGQNYASKNSKNLSNPVGGLSGMTSCRWRPKKNRSKIQIPPKQEKSLKRSNLDASKKNPSKK